MKHVREILVPVY